MLDYQGANPLDLAFDLLFPVLNCRRVIPLYTQVDTRRLTESRPAHTQHVRLGDVTTLALQHKSYIYGGLPLQALSRLWALGL